MKKQNEEFLAEELYKVAEKMMADENYSVTDVITVLMAKSVIQNE